MPSYQPSDRYLTDDEWTTVRKSEGDDKPIMRILHFLYLTGCRAGEARKLQAHHWDGIHRCWKLEVVNSKGEKRRRVIHATDEIVEWAGKQDGYLFKTVTGKQWQKEYLVYSTQGVSNRSGVKFDCRSLRHSYISRGLRKGIPAVTLRRLVGHTSTRMIDMVYGHIDDGQLAAAASSINS
jgi:integrase